MPTPLQLYCLSPQVRSRLIEYCGGSGEDAASCTASFLVADNGVTAGLGIPPREAIIAPSDLERPLGRGVEVFRSLWDRESVLGILDVDFQNVDFPDAALQDAAGSFEKLEPLFQCVDQELRSLGLDHLAVMTGQGYHFVWRVADGSPERRPLESLGRLPDTLEAKYLHDHPFTDVMVPLAKGRAHAGMGVLTEYLAHRVLRRVYERASIPTVVTGLAVGSPGPGRGRESASLDLSAYGDPLYMRYTRCAFSLYRKPSYPDLTLVALPRGSESWSQLMPVRSDLALAADCASRAGATIPRAEPGVRRLFNEYLVSDLRRFHLYFDSGWHDEPQDWPQTYDRLDLGAFSPCVAWPLARPYDAVAKPTNIQNIARVLVSNGWHPRAVAGLIRSRYERDLGWGVNWLNYDAATRADFYVRLFCGLIATGLDDLRDFNCISHQEKGFCPQPWCGFNLADYNVPLRRALQV